MAEYKSMHVYKTTHKKLAKIAKFNHRSIVAQLDIIVDNYKKEKK